MDRDPGVPPRGATPNEATVIRPTSSFQRDNPEGDGRGRDRSGERAPRERPAHRSGWRATPFHEPHPAAPHAALPEGGRGVARARLARALHRRFPRGPGGVARGDPAGLSTTNMARLTDEWEAEYRAVPEAQSRGP